MNKPKPISIENRWDILYAEYPEVYDAFASVPKTPTMIETLKKHFDLKDKKVLDIGSGAGDSTFQLASISKEVIGLEIEDAMREIAEDKAKVLGISNVSFMKGDAMKITLPNQSVDASIAITLPLFIEDDIRKYIREAIRVTKKEGYVINLGIAPFCYGGNLAPIILGESRITEEDTEGVVDRILRDEFGFSFFDYDVLQIYDSPEHMISTYGFIFGSDVIHHIRENKISQVTWTYRVHYLKIN